MYEKITLHRVMAVILYLVYWIIEVFAFFLPKKHIVFYSTSEFFILFLGNILFAQHKGIKFLKACGGAFYGVWC